MSERLDNALRTVFTDAAVRAHAETAAIFEQYKTEVEQQWAIRQLKEVRFLNIFEEMYPEIVATMAAEAQGR